MTRTLPACAGLLLLATVLASGNVVSAQQPQSQGCSPTLTMDDGVFVTRMVLNLEYRLKARDSSAEFLPLSGILKLSDAESLKPKVKLTDDENGLYKGYVLRVTAQGSRFGASLVPDKRGCGLAFFVDERNLIYIGRALGPRAAAEPQPQPSGPTLSEDEGVQVMRRVADVEMNSFYLRFRPLTDILASPNPEAPLLKADVNVTDDENGSFRGGYVLRVTGKDSRFEASRVPDKRGCGLAFFVDERLLIYTASC